MRRSTSQFWAVCGDQIAALDIDQPVDGLHPPADADLIRAALDRRFTPDQLKATLR